MRTSGHSAQRARANCWSFSLHGVFDVLPNGAVVSTLHFHWDKRLISDWPLDTGTPGNRGERSTRTRPPKQPFRPHQRPPSFSSSSINGSPASVSGRAPIVVAGYHNPVRGFRDNIQHVMGLVLGNLVRFDGVLASRRCWQVLRNSSHELLKLRNQGVAGIFWKLRRCRYLLGRCFSLTFVLFPGCPHGNSSSGAFGAE